MMIGFVESAKRCLSSSLNLQNKRRREMLDAETLLLKVAKNLNWLGKSPEEIEGRERSISEMR